MDGCSSEADLRGRDIEKRKGKRDPSFFFICELVQGGRFLPERENTGPSRRCCQSRAGCLSAAQSGSSECVFVCVFVLTKGDY